MRLQDISGLSFTRMLQGFTCLHMAAYIGREDITETLLENGADPNIGDDSVSLEPCRLILVMHFNLCKRSMCQAQHVVVFNMKSCVHGHVKKLYAHKSHGYVTRSQ